MALSFCVCSLLAISSYLIIIVKPSPIEGPRLVGDTPLDGSCISVPFGTTWTAQITAQSDSR